MTSQSQSFRDSKAEDSPEELKTGGELVMRLLHAKQVDFIFGTTDGAMNDIQDAMTIIKPPKWIQGLHEFVSINAASGYALASERVGVSMVGRIVGTLNAAGAGYSTWALSAPVVILASTNAPGVEIPNELPEYHYFGNQFQPIEPFLKWRTLVSSLDTLPDDLDKAFFLAGSEHPGITYVALRQDLMASKPKLARLSRNEAPYVSPMVPDEETANELVTYLLESEQPEVLTLKLGRHPASVRSLVDFAHTFGVAVRDDRSFMNFPASDPFYVDVMEGPRPPELLAGTDLVFAIEYGLMPMYTFKQPVNAVHMTSDPLFSRDVPSGGGDYGSTPFEALKRVVCDSGPTLDLLVRLGRTKISQEDSAKIRERSERIREMHERTIENWKKEAEDHFKSGKLDGWSIGHSLASLWSENLIWANGSITFSNGLVRALQIDTPGSIFGNISEHLGTMVGFAYGAAMADRHYVDVQDKGKYKIGRISPSGRTVVCTTGDGDAIFGNINSALWTCKHYGIGVLYVILNNACWGVEWPPIEKSPQHWAKDAGDFEFLDIDNPRIDFTSIAASVGVRSMKVESTENLETAIREGLETTKKDEPFLIDVWAPKHTGQNPSVVP